MSNLIFKKSSSSSKKEVVVGKSKHEVMMIKCKKHPKHKQSPGVCSLCLIEKLSRLSSKRVTMRSSYCSSSSSSSSLSSHNSSSASSCSSPMYKFTTNGHHGKHSLSTLLFGGGKNNKVLTKSRSLVNFFPRMRSNKQCNDTKKKPNGIFYKLLKLRSKKIDEGLVHSRTLKEIIVTTS